MNPIVLGLAPFVLFPALVFLFVPGAVRRIAFVAALAVAAICWLTVRGGAGNPLYLLMIASAGIAAGALIIEAAAQLRTLIKARRPANG